jgi:hypothetical protein
MTISGMVSLGVYRKGKPQCCETLHIKLSPLAGDELTQDGDT